MQQSPFRILAGFPELDVHLFLKADRINTRSDLAMDLGAPSLAVPKQVHGTRTIIVRAPMLYTEDADGIATDEPHLTLAVAMADCQVMVAYDPATRVIGLLHAGWRGLVAGAIPAFFETLKHEWHVDPRGIFIGFAPSLCLQCSDFTDPVCELPNIDSQFFHGRHIDLLGIADDALDDLGVPLSQRERHPDCTCCHPDLYWSYRGGDAADVRKGWENVVTIMRHET